MMPNERYTPRELLAVCAGIVGVTSFDLDVAATRESSCAARFYSVEDDGLAKSWDAAAVWCNPPFDNLEAWVTKAWREHQARAFDVAAMLVPATRTEQRWWQIYVEPWRDSSHGLAVRFLAGRPRFTSPDPDAEVKSPTFGCALLVWRTRAGR